MKELGVNKFFIGLIENVEAKDKNELRAKEGHYIRQEQPSLIFLCCW